MELVIWNPHSPWGHLQTDIYRHVKHASGYSRPLSLFPRQPLGKKSFWHSDCKYIVYEHIITVGNSWPFLDIWAPSSRGTWVSSTRWRSIQHTFNSKNSRWRLSGFKSWIHYLFTRWPLGSLFYLSMPPFIHLEIGNNNNNNNNIYLIGFL